MGAIEGKFDLRRIRTRSNYKIILKGAVNVIEDEIYPGIEITIANLIEPRRSKLRLSQEVSGAARQSALTFNANIRAGTIESQDYGTAVGECELNRGRMKFRREPRLPRGKRIAALFKVWRLSLHADTYEESR
jgi:hypothetical protein